MPSIVNVPGIGRLSDDDRSRLYWGVTNAGRNPDYVATIISIESGFKPDAKNPYGSASGLIQVIDSVARSKYGITAAELRTRSARWQIENVVSKWPWPKSGDVGDYYMALFLPAFVGKPDGFVLGEKGSTEILYGKTSKGKIYDENHYDHSGKGFFTVGDVKALARGKYNAAAAKDRLPVSETPPSSGSSGSKPFPFLAVGSALLAGAALWAATRKGR